MVLEALSNPINAESKPWTMFFVGFLYNSVALFLSWWIFFSYASMIMVFLTTIAAIPLIYGTMRLEEEKDEEIESEGALLKQHAKAIALLSFLFVGAITSIVMWYMILPGSITSSLFGAQIETITSINPHITGNAISSGALTRIFINNLGVLFFSMLFALIYGFGAIFVLIWNASVIGVYVGNLINNNLAHFIGATGLAKLSGYFQSISGSFLKVFFHGSLEILAYVFGGLAGGILSISLVRHRFETEHFQKIILDTANLLFIALGFLILAAIVEVYLSPLL
ncbi:MAG: stage II sporulation protein M [Nanoarchaeota archaeon]